jgi:colanic acid biosynthesis glycosyl transferase WcaI
LRIVLHDYAGHPFQIQLSRELARRGYEVHHIYFADDVTPRGALTPRSDDPPSLTIKGIRLDTPFDKFSYWKRIRYERDYGARAARYVNEVDPDILVNTNVPVDALAMLRQRCTRPGRKHIVWLQDIVSVGVTAVLRRKLPVVGELVGRRYQAVERINLRAADHVICITDDFLPILQGWKIPPHRCSVIENWAPLDELKPWTGASTWLAEQGLTEQSLAEQEPANQQPGETIAHARGGQPGVPSQIVLYSGTLGLKHNPRLLLEAAQRLRDRPDTAFVVIAEGAGANWLREQVAQAPLPNLKLLPFQPYERLSEILSSAAVLVAVLEPDAGIFCVPSKVLSYLCIGRPIVLAAPPENLAARTVERAGAGRVVDPGDSTSFTRALQDLLDRPDEARQCGRQARAYAEATFAIGTIASQFEQIWGMDQRTPLAA